MKAARITVGQSASTVNIALGAVDKALTELKATGRMTQAQKGALSEEISDKVEQVDELNTRSRKYNLPGPPLRNARGANQGAGEFAGAVPIRRFEHDAEYETTLGFYQILNQGMGNLTNEPLKPNAPTLSRTDMITIQ